MDIIKQLFRDNYLMGAGYNKSLGDLSQVLPLDIIRVASGTKFDTWTVPDEWIIKDAWVKFNGEKVIDLKDNPLTVMIYSQSIHETMPKAEFIKHLSYSDEKPESVPYEFSFYEKNWGFSVKKDFVFKKAPAVCEPGKECPDVFTNESNIPDGDYEVFIDAEFKQGVMQIGVHTIPGKTDREILLFAHLDHPYQANDNLSSVQVLVDLASRLKAEHTIKMIFCPETIGSIAYANMADISKVEFVIALECVGSNNPLLIQKSYDEYAKINYAAHLAVHELGITYMKGLFRQLIGSDEYYFNDPLVGIPGILLSRWAKPNYDSYPEYHTSADTPETVNPEMIKETEDVVEKIIEIYEKDYIPKRTQKGVLMRSSIGAHTPYKSINRDLDYLWYDCDGKKRLSEIVIPLGLTFTQAYTFFETLEKNNLIKHENSSPNTRKRTVKKAPKQEQT